MSDAPAGRDDAAPDARRAPRWGEYATPEEVAALRREQGLDPLPPPRALAGSDADAAARTAAPSHPGRTARGDAAPPPRGRAPAPGVAGARVGVRAWDPALTVGLLVLGAWNAISSIPFYTDFGALLRAAGSASGLGDLRFGEAAHTGGIVLLVGQFVVLAAAIVLSALQLRRRRLAFWIPLTAGVLTSVLTVAVVAIIMLNTPEALAIVQNRS